MTSSRAHTTSSSAPVGGGSNNKSGEPESDTISIDVVKIATLNVSGLDRKKGDSKLRELMARVIRQKLLAVALQETWMPNGGVEVISDDDGVEFTLLKNGTPKPARGRGVRGVAILMSPIATRLWDQQARTSGDRIVAARFKPRRGRAFTIVSAYAPHRCKKNTEPVIQKFRDELTDITNSVRSCDAIFIGIDANCQIGVQPATTRLHGCSNVGPYGCQKKSKGGDELIDVLHQADLCAHHTHFKKRPAKCYTWHNISGGAGCTLDMWIGRCRDRKFIIDCAATSKWCGSDHKAVILKYRPRKPAALYKARRAGAMSLGPCHWHFPIDQLVH